MLFSIAFKKEFSYVGTGMHISTWRSISM